MTEAKHTKGPWEWDYFSNGFRLVSQTEMAYGTTRKSVDLSYEGPNRNLIAAAPELLSAAIDAASLLQELQDGGANEIHQRGYL